MRVFAKAVEYGGFSDAAKELGMSPSAISRSITRLEARLGVPLFVRKTPRSALTADGEFFYRRVVRIMAEIDEIERDIAGCARPDRD